MFFLTLHSHFFKKMSAKLKVKSDKGMTAKKYAELSNAKEAKAIIEEALKASKKEKIIRSYRSYNDYFILVEKPC